MRVFFSFAFVLAFTRFFPFEEESGINPERDIDCVKLDKVSIRQANTNSSRGRLLRFKCG